MVKIKEYRYGTNWVTKDTITAGQARAIFKRAKEKGLEGMSRVNPRLTRQQAYDILSATLPEDDSEPIRPSIVAKNIVREFGPPNEDAT